MINTFNFMSKDAATVLLLSVEKTALTREKNNQVKMKNNYSERILRIFNFE